MSLHDDLLALAEKKRSRANLELIQAQLGELESVSELITEAQDCAEEYENCLGDADYSAADREEAWNSLLAALAEIAGVL
jgi:hypothetical protein